MFTKKSVGLDISDHTIEAAELIKGGNNIRLSNLGRADLEKGIVVNGRIKNKERLSEILKDVLEKAQPKPITTKSLVFGLSESCVFTHIFKVRGIKNDNLEKEIIEELKTTIPIDHKRLIYDYRVFEPYNYSIFNTLNKEKELKGDRDNFVRLVAVEKNIIFEWNNFFKESGFEVEIFDVESLATFRGMFDEYPKSPVCVVDIGANKTKISIFTMFGLEYSFLLSVAGDVFTDIVIEHLNLDRATAESMKKKNGLIYEKDKDLENKIKSKFKEIIRELKLNINYFENKTNQVVDKIVFIGGSSKMNGLMDYLKYLDLEHKFQLGSHQYENVSLEYIEAIGLNFRKLEKRWKKTDPCFIINNKNDVAMVNKIKSFFNL